MSRRPDPRNSALVNALIEAEWRFVSKWFDQKMRDSAQPALQRTIQRWVPGIVVTIGETCHLGTRPPKLEGIMSESCSQEPPDGGEPFENTRIVGRLDYTGDSELHLDFASGDVSIGRAVVTSLKVYGTVIIELVKMTHAPPWFSGVRVFFPDTPRVDLNVSSKIAGIGISSESIKQAVIKAVSEHLIAKFVVLPNQLGIKMGNRLDAFSLKHTAPQGVLRLAAVQADGLRAPKSPTGSWWRKKLRGRADPYLELTVGAATQRTPAAARVPGFVWDEAEVYDFVVTDWRRQSLRVTLRDEDYGLFSLKPTDLLGRAEIPLAQVILGQEDPARPVQLAVKFRLPKGPGVPRAGQGRLRLLAQWRPLAEAHELTTAMTSHPNEWGLGPPGEARFLLLVDVFHATGLPPAEAGTQHWASVSVGGGRRAGSVDFPPADVPSAVARTPVQHGEILLSRLNIPPEVMSERERATFSRILWRAQVRPTPMDDGSNEEQSQLVDVVWNRRFAFMLDTTIGARVRVAVYRPDRGKSRFVAGSSIGSRSLGSVDCALTMERLGQRLATDLQLPLLDGEVFSQAGDAQLKLRLSALHLQPLLRFEFCCRSKAA